MDLVYPVGSYFITESSDYDTPEKVQQHLGGTWTRVSLRFLRGSQGESAGEEGGMSTHSHSLGTPNDTYAHALLQWNAYNDGNTGIGFLEGEYGNGYVPNIVVTPNGEFRDLTDTQPRASTVQVVGYTKPAEWWPPYRTVHMYRRTG